MQASHPLTRWLPIRRRLLIFLAFCMVPATLLLGLQWAADLERAREEGRQDAAAAVRVMTAQFARDVSIASGIARVLLTIDRSPAGLARCPGLLADILQATSHSALNYALVAPSGEILCSGLPQANPPARFDGRPYFMHALATGQPVISGQIFGRITGQSTVHLVVPHRDARGVVDVAAVVAMDVVNVTATAARPGIVAILVDSSGQVASAFPSVKKREPGADARQSGIWTSLQAGKLSGQAAGLDGLPRYFAAQPYEFRGQTAFWMVADTEARELEEAVWQRMRWHALAALLVASATALFALLGIRHLLLGRVLHLREAASRIAGGGSKERIPIGVLDELTPVENSFNAMLDEIERQLADAHDREVRYRHLFDGNFDGVIENEPEGPVLQANAAAHRLLGYAPGELIGMEVRQLIPEDDRRLAELLSRREATGAVSGELSMLHKDGNRLELELWSSLFRGADGKMRNWLVLHDISERKRNDEAIRLANLQLEQRVIDRTQALDEANRDLRRANQDLQAFSFSVSHDLRAPVATVASFTQYLQEHADLAPEKQRHYLTRIAASAHRMGDLIEALLQLARIGQASMRVEPVDLSALCLDVGAELSEAHPGRRVDFVVQPGMVVRGDSVLLRNVMANLLGNAWKFTQNRSDARVTVRAAPDGAGHLSVEVADNGAGFDADYADRLFRPFQRLHEETQFPGLGIGLATVHRIVERHHGSIDASSTPGAGAVFHLRLQA